MFEHVLLSHPVVEDFSVQVVAFSTPLTSGEFEVDYIEGNIIYEHNRSLNLTVSKKDIHVGNLRILRSVNSDVCGFLVQK